MAMDGMSPRKQMGMGSMIPKTRGNNDNEFSMSKGESFGVSPIPGGVPGIGHMDRDNGGMPVDGRGAPPPIPRSPHHLHNQANPDHGPHHMSIGHHPDGMSNRPNPGRMRRAMKSSYGDGW